MKKASKVKSGEDELCPEYDFDFSKSRPNRFADRFGPDSVSVVLEPDVAEVSNSSESVNRFLRSVIRAVNKTAAGPPAKERQAR